MFNLTNGYYWLKNRPYDDKPIFRPVKVTKLTESGYCFDHNWYPPGTYIQWIGDNSVYFLSYFQDPVWKDVEFIPLEEPQHLG